MLKRESLITSVQERLIANNYSFSRQLNHPVLEKEEYNTLANFSQREDMVCQELLFSCLGRFVHDAVSGFIYDDDHAGWTYEDLMQSGFLGIGEALKKWKVELGDFTPYSMWYIKREIRSQIHTLGNMIFICDPHRATLASSITRYRGMCESEFGIEVSNDTLADWMNKNGYSKNVKNGRITAKDIFSMEEVQVSITLDQPVDMKNDVTRTFLDIFIDPETVTPLTEIVQKETRSEKRYLARRLLETLTEKQKTVVELYYGFDIEATCLETSKITFESVAKVMESRRKESWDKFKCQQLHQRAVIRMRKLISVFSEGVDYNYV